jgi:hypothetical protein
VFDGEVAGNLTVPKVLARIKGWIDYDGRGS